MFQFRKGYFLVAVILLIVEILIAAFLHDRIIRPYIGDLLVVILMYCALKSFINIPIIPLAIGVLLFAYLIEVLQYFKFIKWIGFDKYELARIVLGVGFSWIDMLCYTIGIILVVVIEFKIRDKEMEHGWHGLSGSSMQFITKKSIQSEFYVNLILTFTFYIFHFSF